MDSTKKENSDPWTSLRCHKSTVKKLEKYKTDSKDNLESVIKRAVETHGKYVEIKRKREQSNAS